MTMFRVESTSHVAQSLERTDIAKAINLSKADKNTLTRVINGLPVSVADAHRAVVAGLAVAVTRRGQSMARRSDREALLALYNLLPAPEGVTPLVEIRKATRTVYQPSPTEQARRERVEQAQAAEITRLRSQVRALQAVQAGPFAADQAAASFAHDIMTPEQRQRVSDFRTGYRTAQQS